MRTFGRALRYTRPYLGRLYLSLGCGLVVALFWGGNISALYPILSVLLDRKNFVQWVGEREEACRQEIKDVQADLDHIAAEGSADQHPVKIERKHAQIANARAWLKRYENLRPWLQQYTPSDPFHTLCVLMAVLLVSMVLKTVFDFLQEYLAAGVVQLAVFDLRNRLFRKTMNQDLGAFSDQGTHELMARFNNDFESLTNGMKALLSKVLLEPLKAVSCLVFACLFNWRLTLLALCMFPLVAVVMGVTGRSLKRVSRRNLESCARMFKILQESFQGVRIVKAFTMERYERRRLYTENKRFFQQSMRLNRTDALGGPVVELLASAAIATAVLAGAYLVMTRERDIFGVRLTAEPLESTMLFTFFALIGGVCDPLRKVFSVYGRVQRGIAASDRIFECMDRENRVAQAPKAVTLPRHRQAVRFQDVSFGYFADRPVLHHVNLDIEFGETLAFVGPTGCGKTTLVNLLPRFFDPTAGRVLIDGRDIRGATLRSLRRQIGIVTQHTMLFDDTIYNNIRYGQPFADRPAVEAAAKAAFAHDFILKDCPAGYETRIGEMGERLAGGQRQRIALARAILRDPAILILDEATSSLDVLSESLIHKTLRSFAKGRTTFIVTHRLSVLDMADRIVVVNAGRIEAVGSFTEVMRASPTFNQLNEVQAKAG